MDGKPKNNETNYAKTKGNRGLYTICKKTVKIDYLSGAMNSPLKYAIFDPYKVDALIFILAGSNHRY
jgi:hypothetical protein